MPPIVVVVAALLPEHKELRALGFDRDLDNLRFLHRARDLAAVGRPVLRARAATDDEPSFGERLLGRRNAEPEHVGARGPASGHAKLQVDVHIGVVHAEERSRFHGGVRRVGGMIGYPQVPVATARLERGDRVDELKILRRWSSLQLVPAVQQWLGLIAIRLANLGDGGLILRFAGGSLHGIFPEDKPAAFVQPRGQPAPHTRRACLGLDPVGAGWVHRAIPPPRFLDRVRGDLVVLLDLICRDEEFLACCVERARAAVGWQPIGARLHTEQLAERVGILATVQPSHRGAAAGVGQRLAGHDDHLGEILQQVGLGSGHKLLGVFRRHLTRVQDVEHLPPAVGRVG